MDGRFNEWKDPDFETYKDFPLLKMYIEYVNNSNGDRVKKLSHKNLKREIIHPWGEKPDARVTIEGALIHMVMEDMADYGELSGMFRQMGLGAPYLAFLRYKHSIERTPF